MEENKKDVLPLEGEPLTAPQISEPVVNALAAALSKIETYVPTQYINDGPPDIDADHLNHAEQAIMRVTNLANGAADAIAALQSQVTQLNNNFQYKELTNDFDLNNALGKYRTDSSIIITSLKNKPSEIRNSGEATIDWYPANERNTYGIQIMRWTYGNTHMIFTRNKIENTWAEWVQYVTKSDLGDLITHRKTTGNTSDSGNITINRPEGYSLIGAYINSVYVRLSIPTVYQKTIIVRCFDENMSPLKNTLVEVISLWIKKDISY